MFRDKKNQEINVGDRVTVGEGGEEGILEGEMSENACVRLESGEQVTKPYQELYFKGKARIPAAQRFAASHGPLMTQEDMQQQMMQDMDQLARDEKIKGGDIIPSHLDGTKTVELNTRGPEYREPRPRVEIVPELGPQPPTGNISPQVVKPDGQPLEKPEDKPNPPPVEFPEAKEAVDRRDDVKKPQDKQPQVDPMKPIEQRKPEGVHVPQVRWPREGDKEAPPESKPATEPVQLKDPRYPTDPEQKEKPVELVSEKDDPANNPQPMPTEPVEPEEKPDEEVSEEERERRRIRRQKEEEGKGEK